MAFASCVLKQLMFVFGAFVLEVYVPAPLGVSAFLVVWIRRCMPSHTALASIVFSELLETRRVCVFPKLFGIAIA